MQFKWQPNSAPPEIEEHSRAKLDVLRAYLRAYFDRLNVNPHREQFRLDLVDGFAGGGTFLECGDIISGTPLIMLEEAQAAKQRLNLDRRKELQIDCKFYFVDKAPAHTDHLRQSLKERGHNVDQERIVISTNDISVELPSITNSILKRQPKAGRAIFVLDQTGFAQIELRLVARIFDQLPMAEVILTFAADSLINHLADRPEFVQAVSPLQLTESQIRALSEWKRGEFGRALVQRMLRDHIRMYTGATFDTPFFIRPRASRRALWFLHLSKHPTARDVMMQCHWEVQGTFEHYGSGGFQMLGWDALQTSRAPELFQFEEEDGAQMHQELLRSLPNELFPIVSDGPVSVKAIHRMFANRTAARFSDFNRVLLTLFKENELQIHTPEGKARSKHLVHLRPSDLISTPSISNFPELSRRRN